MTETPRCPSGVGAAGRALWKRIVGDVAPELELDQRDLAVLSRAAKTADRIAELDAAIERDGLVLVNSKGDTRLHPAAAELRLNEASLARLLGGIDLDDAAAGSQSGVSRRARKAAQERWRHAGPSRRESA
jgi:phage terminase small subunit